MSDAASMNYRLAEFTSADAGAVDRVALAAFAQYRHEYTDWETFSRMIGNMAALADAAELIVARVGAQVAGAVAYVGPGGKRASFFEPEWALLRMLVVDPGFRGMGIGRNLTLECIRRARRDGAPRVALHTSPIMKAALSLYENIGFRFEREAPSICGLPYGIYLLSL